MLRSIQPKVARERAMSMSLWILSNKQLNSIEEWQVAIDAEGYPLRLSAGMIFERLSGFFPMYLRGELTGFEFYHDDLAELRQLDIAELKRANSHIDLDHDWKFMISFSWLGSKEDELLAAWMAATAYAHATDGIIFDGEGFRFVTSRQAREIVHEFEDPSSATMTAIRETRAQLRRKTTSTDSSE
jgi:hypothetical protein